MTTLFDPIKVGVMCPGMKSDGQLDASGIPADIVTAYLGRHGIVPSRTTDHMVLFLFSMGITKGKWGTLLNTLLDFKTVNFATGTDVAFEFVPDPRALLIAVAVAVLVGLLGGALPALRAARMNPVVAMRP